MAYLQNHYSVPWRYIGLTLPVRITEEEIVIYGPQIEEVARHRLLPREVSGQVVRLPKHEPADDAEKKYEVLQERYAELGEVAARFLQGLVQRRRYGKDEAQKILALLQIYRRQDLLAAIERAVRYGAYSRSAVERILAAAAAPKTAVDQMADQETRQLKSLLGDEPVLPRSGKEYDRLLDPPSSEPQQDRTQDGQPEERPSETSHDETEEERPETETENPPAGPAGEDS